jgi:predicted nucleic acid-binding protein
VIVDASVVFKWLVREPDSELATAWIGRAETLVAPMLVLAETGHALTKRIRMGEIAPEGAIEQFRRIPSLLTLRDYVSFAPLALELAIQLHHSFYDCVYLAMASATNDTLLTADEKFIAKASAAGFGYCFSPLDASA